MGRPPAGPLGPAAARRSPALLLALSGFLAVSPPAAAQSPAQGRIEFTSSHEALNRGFAWARDRALSFAFEGDPVGPWFEAALPGREAFCMRDVSHQAQGALALGLHHHLKNMFARFAASIALSRDWAGYWEIDRLDRPAPVDYRSDDDFWYNLPANFDLVAAMQRAWEWTGDRDYLEEPGFREFYRRSLTDYVAAWDADGDGVMGSPPESGIRGLPTYWEGEGPRAFTGADLVAAQFAANLAYAAILDLRGEGGAAEPFRAAALRLQRLYNDGWWNPSSGRFNTAVLPDGSFDASPLPLGQIYPLWFGIVEPGPRRQAMVASLPDGGMVELNSYLPEILYRNGAPDRALRALLAQLDPGLPRRDYPEVSFTAVGHLVGLLMGVRPLASEGVVETKARLTSEVSWAELRHVPVLGLEASVLHRGAGETRLRNGSGRPMRWRAVFAGDHPLLLWDGIERPARARIDPGEGAESWLEGVVEPGQEAVVTVPTRR